MTMTTTNHLPFGWCSSAMRLKCNEWVMRMIIPSFFIQKRRWWKWRSDLVHISSTLSSSLSSLFSSSLTSSLSSSLNSSLSFKAESIRYLCRKSQFSLGIQPIKCEPMFSIPDQIPVNWIRAKISAISISKHQSIGWKLWLQLLWMRENKATVDECSTVFVLIRCDIKWQIHSSSIHCIGCNPPGNSFMGKIR